MTVNTLLALLILGVVAGVVIYFVTKIRAQANVLDDGAPMPVGARSVLIGYLLLLGLLLGYMLVSLNSLDFPDTAAIPREVPIPSPSPSPTQSGSGTTTPSPSPSPSPSSPANEVEKPTLFRVFPQTSTSSPPTVRLTLYGKNFKEKSKIRFNTQPADTGFISQDLIAAQLEPRHLVSVGTVMVEVEQDGLVSNAVGVPITRPLAPLNVFGWQFPISRDVQLLLLVIFAGALGSFFHAVKSLADFIGNRTLTSSWFWWYITRPFLGMALALVFYAVLRGGFVIGSPADAKVVNAFGVLAIGALVGMFSDKAAQKLAEVFDVIFKAGDPRTGKLDAPVIDRLEPETVTVGETKPIVLKIIGDRLGKVSMVRMNSEDRKPDTVSEKEITLKLKPEDVQTKNVIKITAVNPDGGTSTPATLHISDLAISDTSLPNATVGGDYRHTMTASGGTPPYKWSLVKPPSWLSINEKTGELKGKPGAGDAKDTPVTVNLTDKEGATVSKSLTLKVNV